MNLSNSNSFTTIIIIILAVASAMNEATATAKKTKSSPTRLESCISKYSIGGTTPDGFANGRLVYPDSKHNCQYGVKLLAEDAADIRIKCFVKKMRARVC